MLLDNSIINLSADDMCLVDVLMMFIPTSCPFCAASAINVMIKAVTLITMPLKERHHLVHKYCTSINAHS